MISFIPYSIAAIVSLPLVVLAAECLFALMPARKRDCGDRLPCAVLIPAHNEARVLAKTLANVKSELTAGDRCIVVAHNCTDGTSDVAKAEGVEVAICDDPMKKGKGFALDAGIAFIKNSRSGVASTPDVVVIVDADCTLTQGSLDRLVRASASSDRPQQAVYLMQGSPSYRPTRRLSVFAFLLKNWVRPRGLHQLGLCVPLYGTGMAFSWSLIRDLDLATPEIVEDLQLGLRLTAQGLGPEFCEQATVRSKFPESDSAAKQQHRRWEHGYLGQMIRQLPKLVRRGVCGNMNALGASFDLVVPPLSLLAAFVFLGLASLSFAYWITGNPAPLLLLLAVCSVSCLAVFAAWFRFGRSVVSISDLFWIPVYAIRKVPLYMAFLFHAESRWIRTERNS